MAYFLIQHRHFQPPLEGRVAFPVAVSLSIRFGPADAFGVQADSPRTTGRRAEPARVIWNANEGVSVWEGATIDTIRATERIGQVGIEWIGNVLQLTFTANSIDNINNVVGLVNHVLPAFLSFRLRVFVWIQEFTATLG